MGRRAAYNDAVELVAVAAAVGIYSLLLLG